MDPSVNPSDPLVKSAIEQVRFRISNSSTLNRQVVRNAPWKEAAEGWGAWPEEVGSGSGRGAAGETALGSEAGWFGSSLSLILGATPPSPLVETQLLLPEVICWALLAPFSPAF